MDLTQFSPSSALVTVVATAYLLGVSTRRVDRLEIGFNLANNPLAQPGDHPVYVRITEPTGNLITNGDVFRVNNEELQYTEAESINFKNDGELYTLSWAPADYNFQKGTYTVILYSDKSIMGRSTVHLK